MRSLSSPKQNIAITAWQTASFVTPPPVKTRDTGYHQYMTEQKVKTIITSAKVQGFWKLLSGKIRSCGTTRIKKEMPTIGGGRWGGEQTFTPQAETEARFKSKTRFKRCFCIQSLESNVGKLWTSFGQNIYTRTLDWFWYSFQRRQSFKLHNRLFLQHSIPLRSSIKAFQDLREIQVLHSTG